MPIINDDVSDNERTTISRQLDKYEVKKNVIKPQPTVLIIDTTYFWRSFWIMVFRSHKLKKNFLRKEVSRKNKKSCIEWMN